MVCLNRQLTKGSPFEWTVLNRKKWGSGVRRKRVRDLEMWSIKYFILQNGMLNLAKHFDKTHQQLQGKILGF